MAKSTLWINQLPFAATAEDIAAHFAAAIGKPAAELLDAIRLVKKDGKFKGTAFMDVFGWEAVDAGTSLHQSRLKAKKDNSQRRINVREAVSKTQLEIIAEKSKATKEAKIKEIKAQKALEKKAEFNRPKIYSDDESEAESEAEEEEGSDKSEDDSDKSEEDEDEDEDKDGEDDEAEAKGGLHGDLGKDREGRTIVGEIDPQRKRKRVEEELLQQRRQLADMPAVCADCGGDFLFTVLEQEFFNERGWSVPRKRCKPCTTAKKSKPRDQQQANAPHGGGGGGKGGASKGAEGKGGAGKGGGGKGGDRGRNKPSAAVGSGVASPKGPKKNGAEALTCFLCGQVGHIANGCPQKKEGSVFKCHNCGENGHKRSECPKLVSSGGNMGGKRPKK